MKIEFDGDLDSLEITDHIVRNVDWYDEDGKAAGSRIFRHESHGTSDIFIGLAAAFLVLVAALWLIDRIFGIFGG